MKTIAIDIETNGVNLDGGIIWMLSITRGNTTELIHDCEGIKKLRPDIQKELCSPTVRKIVHSGVFDLPFIEKIFGCKIHNVWDSEVNEVVIRGARVSFKKKNLEPYQIKLLERFSSKLEYTIPRYGYPIHDKSIVENFIDRPRGKKFSSIEINYAKSDTKFLPSIQIEQEKIIRAENLTAVSDLENKTTERLADMRVRGIGVDKKMWRNIANENEREFERRMKILPKGINWNSPKQVKEFFLSKKLILNSFADMYDLYLNTKNKFLGNFIYARELHKAVTSYGNNWFDEGIICNDSRIRSFITQCINTGRMAYSHPNLQQLPGEETKMPKKRRVIEMIAGANFHWKHREAFRPTVGSIFVSGDFSGQEMGIMAAASNETWWLDAMQKGHDLHAMTAAMLNPTEWLDGKEKSCAFPFKCSCKVHKYLREPAKINNFMLAYGGGAARLADSIGVDILPIHDARILVGKHKRLIPRLNSYLESNGRDALRTGVSFSADPYRRRRILRGEEDWQVKNQGKNNPIQSAGANMLKRALIQLPDSLPVVLVIHDQIILEVPKREGPKAQKILKATMEEAANYITGIKGLIRVAPTLQMNIAKT
jgi:DNA polymerase I-like protein with 3'-5' exonuclease and polymerase domains